MSNGYDLLLEWCSEKTTGRWQDFRAAWSWLSAKGRARPTEDPAARAWIAAANLSALAHLELSWEGEGVWNVAPPVLTMLPNSGGRALLTGARTRTLYCPEGPAASRSGVLADAADALNLWIDDVRRGDRPTAVVIACEKAEDAEELAEACGIAYSYSVSEQLSAMLPPLAAYLRLWQPGPLPQGFPVEAFDVRMCEWRESDEDEARSPGLYRCRTWREHVHVLTTATGATLRVSREHAVYEVLRWEDLHVLSYRAPTLELWVPAHVPLPLMQERAAVLCSGQLPRFRRLGDIPGRAYVNVQPAVAERIAASLCQELEIDD
jgi:hypothetical protein